MSNTSKNTEFKAFKAFKSEIFSVIDSSNKISANDYSIFDKKLLAIFELKNLSESEKIQKAIDHVNSEIKNYLRKINKVVSKKRRYNHNDYNFYLYFELAKSLKKSKNFDIKKMLTRINNVNDGNYYWDWRHGERIDTHKQYTTLRKNKYMLKAPIKLKKKEIKKAKKIKFYLNSKLKQFDDITTTNVTQSQNISSYKELEEIVYTALKPEEALVLDYKRGIKEKPNFKPSKIAKIKKDIRHKIAKLITRENWEEYYKYIS